MDPLKIFVAVMPALFTAVLVSLVVAAGMTGDWFTAIIGGVGTSAMIGMGVELLRA